MYTVDIDAIVIGCLYDVIFGYIFVAPTAIVLTAWLLGKFGNSLMIILY